MVVHPAGWYALFAVVVLLWLGQLVHPIILARPNSLAPPKSYNRWWWYVAWIVGLSVVTAFIAPNRGKLFGYDHYYIPSMSMAPTLQAGDRIAVDAWRYRAVPPALGDIVVCDFGDGTLVVKRVVGVPGDTIELRGPQVVRNGRLVEEPYASAEPRVELPDAAPLMLGADEFFLLGDNRANSFDSRQRGPLGRGQIYSRVEFVYFSSSGTVNWERFPVVLGAD